MAAAAAALSLVEHIHHEKQEQGSMLCAQHALNALLQGSYYDPSQLADIARQLDELEKDQVDDETWRNRDQSSLNMDDTGYFSVSVLEQALQVWGLRLIRWRGEQMRPFQSTPEERLAFILNLESHWFTIRSFQGGYWFNLNSFLEKPTYVGPSYLGALLDQAETEGYSVFTVLQDEHTRSDFHSSIADQCAATLPSSALVSAEESLGAAAVVNSAMEGLRPTLPDSSKSTSNGKEGDQDEEADLQAALQASLADSDFRKSGASTSASTTGGEVSSRMQSPTIVGQRRARTGARGAHDTEMLTDNDEVETDEQVDAIAPSRRRARGLAPSSSSLSTARGAPYLLPTASGGRRRASRQHSEEGNQASFRRRRARDTGASREDAINLDGDDGSRTITADIAQSTGAIELVDDDDDDDDDDFVQMQSSSAPRSPFLNPALMRSAGSTNSEDDFHSLSSGDEGGALGESWVQHDVDAIRRQAMIQDRSYDDEDAQLQAALAASMGQTVSSAGVGAGAFAVPGTAAGGTVSFEDDLAAADWINEEDQRAIREAQATFTNMTRQVSNRSNSPPPPDVERIARMRADAKRKAEEEEEARLRSATAGVVAASLQEKVTDENNGQSDEESDSDEEPQMSAEEMRRARLARFSAGGAGGS
jgi:ataxin-3